MDLVDELAKMVANAMKVKFTDLSMGNITEDELRLWKLRTPWPIIGSGRSIPDLNELMERFRSDDDLTSTAEELNPTRTLSSYFNESPPAGHLHLIVEAAISGEFSSLCTLNISVERLLWCAVPRVRKVDLSLVNKYARVFMRARQWDFFTEHDVENENGIVEAGASRDPGFVTEFNGMLSRKRAMDQSVRYLVVF